MKILILLASLLFPADAHARRAVMEGLNTTTLSVFVDTGSGRVSIGTGTYHGAQASVSLFVSSNSVFSDDISNLKVIILSTGTVLAREVRASTVAATSILVGSNPVSTATTHGNAFVEADNAFTGTNTFSGGNTFSGDTTFTGAVTLPAQPAFRASRSAAFTIASGSTVTITWDNIELSSGSFFGTTSATAPSAGNYLLTCTVGFQAGGTGLREVGIRDVATSRNLAFARFSAPGGSVADYLSATTLVYMEVGQAVECVVFQSQTANLALQVDKSVFAGNKLR